MRLRRRRGSRLLLSAPEGYNESTQPSWRCNRIMSQTVVRQRRRKTPSRKTVVGPEDDGRRMSLSDFDKAEAKEGYLYELSRGVITVSDVPDFPHQFQLDAAHQQ